MKDSEACVVKWMWIKGMFPSGRSVGILSLFGSHPCPFHQGPYPGHLMAPSIYFCTFNLEACPVPQLLRTTKQSFSLSSALELAPFSFLHFTVNLNNLCFLSGFLHPQPFVISLQCNFLPAISLKASHPHFILLNSQ